MRHPLALTLIIAWLLLPVLAAIALAWFKTRGCGAGGGGDKI